MSSPVQEEKVFSYLDTSSLFTSKVCRRFKTTGTRRVILGAGGEWRDKRSSIQYIS